MRSSSAAKANQLEFIFDTPADGLVREAGRSNQAATGAVFDLAGSQSGVVRLPSFAMAEGTRKAARLNTLSVPESEVIALRSERKQLLEKKLFGTITPAEHNRLDYVRWSLDRVEDAKVGWHLDQLEAYVEHYESLLEQLNDVARQIKHLQSQRN